MSIVSKKFFQGKNTPHIAQSILGKVLARRYHGKTRAYIITEIEAYNGPYDKASHAYRGKTARNSPMFGEAGCWYVYFVYGAHWMLNIVTGPKDYPAAILIRGVVPLNNSIKKYLCTAKIIPRKNYIVGPGKLTRALKIDKKFNGKRASKKTGLWIEDWGVKIPPRAIIKTPRIGVSYAKEWAQKQYRFVLKTTSLSF